MAKFAYTEVAVKYGKVKQCVPDTAYYHKYGDPAGMTKMEVDQIAPYIQQLGVNGWELISVTDSPGSEDDPYNRCTRWYFKKAYAG